jgi:integrase
MPDQDAAQVPEKQRTLTSDSLRNFVTADASRGHERQPSLYTGKGERKYLNHGERSRVLAVMQSLDSERALFCLMLAWTGARVSEILALSPRSFQVESGLVTIVTLKRRKPCVREVPIPPLLMQSLVRAFDLRRRSVDQSGAHKPIWRFCRMTAWRIIKSVMTKAGVVGLQACPKGLRHAFGVGSLHAGVPITLVQRWMGHARLSSTSIYLDVSGPEETTYARRFWRSTPPHQPSLLRSAGAGIGLRP